MQFENSSRSKIPATHPRCRVQYFIDFPAVTRKIYVTTTWLVLLHYTIFNVIYLYKFYKWTRFVHRNLKAPDYILPTHRHNNNYYYCAVIHHGHNIVKRPNYNSLQYNFVHRIMVPPTVFRTTTRTQ